MDSLDKSDLKNLKDFFKNRTKNIKNEKDEVLAIIGGHLEAIDNSTLAEIEKHESKKALNDIGNFIKLFDETIIIEEVLRTAPDFLLRKNKQLVGLDLNYIYSDSSDIATKSDKIFKELEEELKAVSPEIKGIYKIKFNENLFLKIEDEVLKKAIISSIKNPEFKSDYIENVTHSIGDILYFLLDEVSAKNYLSEEIIKETIANNDTKLSEYRSSVKINEFWLVLVLNDFTDYEKVVKLVFQTKYQKVFICDFSKYTVLELRNKG